MAKILVFTQISEDNVKLVTLEILSGLSGHSLDVAIVGEVSEKVKNDLANMGAENIFAITGDNLEQYSPEGHSQVICEFLGGHSYDYVFAGATSLTKDLLPRVAGIMGCAMVSEITSFEFVGDIIKATRPLYAGKCLSSVELVGPRPHFVTVRPNVLALSDSSSKGAGKVKSESINPTSIRATLKEIVKGVSGSVDLTEANIIVSGGRAMKNSDNFKLLEDLANEIGASVGASRAAVDAGFVPHSMQVGQTGKTVTPSLYIACGISGAIQHLAGMRTSKIIVAINIDPDAPIFSIADYGIVGDLFQIVPILKEELKAIS